MKEVYSLVDMADTEAGDSTHVDIIVEAEITSNGDLPTCLTDHVSASPRLNLMDWAESLIQMTVSAEQPSPDNSDPTSFLAASSHETIPVGGDEDSSAPTRRPISSPHLHGSHTQNNHNWQEMRLEDCLTLIKADSNPDSPRNSPQSTSCSNLPSHDSFNTDSQDSDASAGSARTGNKSSHLDKSSPASSCVPDLGSFHQSDYQRSTSATEVHFFSTHFSGIHEHPHMKRQLTPDALSVVSSGLLTSPISDSFFHVNIDLETAGNAIPLPIAKTSNSSTLDYSLNTPVCETYQPLKSPSGSPVSPSCLIDGCSQFLPLSDSYAVSPKTNRNYMSNNSLKHKLNAPLLATRPPLKTTSGSCRPHSCVTSDGIKSTLLDSSSDSRTISIEFPENHLDLEGHVSDVDTSSTLARVLDDRTQQSLSPVYSSEADPLRRGSDLPLVWAEDNLEDVTVVTCSAHAHEQCSSHSSFQVVQPHDDASFQVVQPHDDASFQVVQPHDDASFQVVQPHDDASFQVVQPHDDASFQVVQPHDDVSTFGLGESLPHFLNNEMTMCNYEIVALPYDFWTNHSEAHMSPDPSGQPHFASSCHSDSNQESKSSECGLLKRSISEDRIIDDVSDVHNYCIDVNLENSFNPVHDVEEVVVSSSIDALPQPSYTHAASYSSFPHKQFTHETLHTLANVTLNTITGSHTDSDLSMHITHQKHKTKTLNTPVSPNNATPVRVNTTVSPNNATPVRVNTTVSPNNATPVRVNTTVSPNNATPVRVNTTVSPNNATPVRVNTTVSPNNATPVRVNRTVSPNNTTSVFWDVSWGAILSPEDVTPVLNVDNGMSREEHAAQARTSSDVDDVALEGCAFSSSFSVASSSYTDGECSQEQPTRGQLKETLRSRLKGKRKVDVSSQKNNDLQNREKSSRFCLDVALSTYTDSPSASSVLPYENDGRYGTGIVTIPEQNSDSCSSSISQDGYSDDDSMLGRDEEDSASTTSSTQTSRRTRDRKHKGGQGTPLAQRERNRLAAQKCRKKKSDRVDTLTQQVQRLELKQGKMKSEVAKLEFEREELQEMLRLHSFFCAKDSMKKK